MKNGNPLVSLSFTSGLGKPHKKIANLRKIWCRILYIEKSLFLSKESLNLYMGQAKEAIQPKPNLYVGQAKEAIQPKPNTSVPNRRRCS